MAGKPRVMPWAGLLAVLLVTAGLRLSNVAELRRDSHWIATSGDSWYHVRRMLWQALGHGPLVSDPWVHFPAGNTAVWPDGFDALGALLTRLLGADLDAALVAGFMLVTLCAVATAALAALAARQLGGNPSAAIVSAGLLIACNPALHNYTQVGKIDHHAAEPLITGAAIWALARCAAGPGRWAAVLSVASLVAPLLLWPSSAMTVGLLGALAGIGVLQSPEPLRRGVGRRLAAVFGAAGLLALPLGLTAPFGEGGKVVAEALSALQPGLLLLAGACLLAMTLPPVQGKWARLASAVAGGGALLLGLLLWGPARQALLGGGDFVAAKGYVTLIAESASTLELGTAGALQRLGWPLLATPVLLLWVWHQPASPQRPGLWMWAMALAIGAGLGLTQLRFATLPAVPLAVLAGAALSTSQRWLRPRLGAAMLGMALLPGLYDVASRSLPLARRVPVWQALDWLKARTTTPGDPWQPGTKPTFSVLAGWGLGHDLLTRGGQANVCSPLIAPGQTTGLDACARLILSAGDEPELIARHQIRWWIATPLPLIAMRAWGTAAGEPADRYVRDLPGGDRAPTEAGQCAAAQILFRNNGSASPDGRCQARPHWRLRHAVPGERAKVFERVAGAVLRGTGCPSGALARVEVRLLVLQGGYLWQDTVRAGADGSWSLRVPWSTEQADDTVRVLQIGAGCGELRPVRIPEAAVIAGQEITISL